MTRAGQAVYRGRMPDGRKVVVRAIRADDAPLLLDYINTLSRERTFIRRQGVQLSLAEEKKFVANQVRGLRAGHSLQYLLFVEGELAGVSGIQLKELSSSHVGEFGISIAKKFRRLGLGTLLMDLVIAGAHRLKGIRIVALTVFGNNPVAQRLYRKQGFRKFGVLPGGSRHRRRFVDQIYMYKKV